VEKRSRATSAATRTSMQGNKARDTAPELAVRRLLHSMGLRYRVNKRPIPTLQRTADILFTRAKLAVFIDGCYWHGCPEDYTAPKANASFWKEKVERNRERDAETNAVLAEHGWKVMRFWTHESPDSVATEIAAALEVRASKVHSEGFRRGSRSAPTAGHTPPNRVRAGRTHSGAGGARTRDPGIMRRSFQVSPRAASGRDGGVRAGQKHVLSAWSSAACRRVRSRLHRSLEVLLEVRRPRTLSYSLSSILFLAYTTAWLGTSECSMRSRPGC
jgi:DNA mismatch endonuclease (patch repair protein)